MPWISSVHNSDRSASAFATAQRERSLPHLEASGNYDVFAMAHPALRLTDQTQIHLHMKTLSNHHSVQPAFCRYLPNASRVQSGSSQGRCGRQGTSE
jgi:hypothetical protein